MKKKKIYVLDTSVILYDFHSIMNFEDNDVAIPIVVLEELDNFKKGNELKNFATREFIRMLDKMSKDKSILEWNDIGGISTGKFKIIMNDKHKKLDSTEIFDNKSNDNKILNCVLSVKEEFKNKNVILVTKDINLRIKARSLQLEAEDYKTGKIKNVDGLYTGSSTITGLDKDVIDEFYKNNSMNPEDINLETIPNHYYILKSGKSSALAYYNPLTLRLERLEKTKVYGITPRNSEQIFALHAIMNPNIKLVTLQGVAGTGKTLLSLAGALQQKKLYKQIYLARPIIPLSDKGLGYLPGSIEDKTSIYMEPLWDNLKFIKDQFSEKDSEHKFITDCVTTNKLVVTPLTYIRGRSISNVLFIIDESQNCTPHEVKTIITRAGEGTKIIFTGDVNQIDSPYLDSQSNGLSYIIDKIKHQPIYGHVKLLRGERSELANLANELL